MGWEYLDCISGTLGASGAPDWDSSSNAWDETDYTYATCTVTGSLSADIYSNTITGIDVDTTTISGDIYRVDIGVVISGSDTSSDQHLLLRPIFDGTNGSLGGIATDDTTLISGSTLVYDVTNDSKAPVTWTWSDVDKLDVKFYIWADNDNTTIDYYLDNIFIRVLTSVDYGIQIFNSSGTKITSLTDRLGRIFYHTTVSGETTISGIDCGFCKSTEADSFGFPNVEDKFPPRTYVSNFQTSSSGNSFNMVCTKSTAKINNVEAFPVDNSEVYAMGYS